ncbi:MAG TPA: RNase P subunit p30 family protein [archaeon]|nr:RNase P subunit p30 family protein [archaeon]
MGFYDYHLHSENLEETIKTAKILGFSGICISHNWVDLSSLEKFRKSLEPHKKQIDMVIGVEIKDKQNRIPVIVEKIRGLAEIILVHGGDLEVNRVSVETKGVDILLHPELGREDPGLNHVIVNLAEKNNVAIEFSLNDIIQSSKITRARLFEKMLFNAKLVKKYKAPFVLTSGAFDSLWMRSPSELTGLGHLLGFSDPQIKRSLSDSFVKENRKRLSKNWVMPGVEIVE